MKNLLPLLISVILFSSCEYFDEKDAFKDYRPLAARKDAIVDSMHQYGAVSDSLFYKGLEYANVDGFETFKKYKKMREDVLVNYWRLNDSFRVYHNKCQAELDRMQTALK